MTKEERLVYMFKLSERVDRFKNYRRLLADDNSKLNGERRLIAKRLGVTLSRVIIGRCGDDFEFRIEERRNEQ